MGYSVLRPTLPPGVGLRALTGKRSHIMRIATVQFAPELGKTQENIRRADVLLEHLSPGRCDLLVLPELAFSGLASACLDA